MGGAKHCQKYQHRQQCQFISITAIFIRQVFRKVRVGDRNKSRYGYLEQYYLQKMGVLSLL